MEQAQFFIYHHQKSIRLQAERAVIYMQGEIIEAYSDNNELYYLFFYKNHFLTAAKAIKLRRQSYIEHAFKEGMVFDFPHPFIHALLSSNHPCQMISFKQLLKKLEMSYSPYEKALILTFFESFIPKKQLFNEIKTDFYKYRRNGQLLLGYQLIRILMDFAPKHSLVKSLASDMNFNKYAVLYSRKPEEVLATDGIFAEKILYSQLENDISFQQLIDRLEKEARWIDVIAVTMSKLQKTPSIDYYQYLTKLLDQHFNETETEYILEQLSDQLPVFLPLQQDLFYNYVKQQKVQKAFTMMNNHNFKLSHAQVHSFGEMLEIMDLDAHSLRPEVLNSIIKAVISLFPEKADMLLTKYVISLLKTYELDFIKNWLDAFKEAHGNLQLFEKINTMIKLSESLDQMNILGELYYEFKQFDKAIECFSWEMELYPSDPKPLQWLAKIYGELGMKHESDAYRNLCIDLQKWA